MANGSNGSSLTWTCLDGGWWRAARGRYSWLVVRLGSGPWTATRVPIGGVGGEAKYLGERDTTAKALALCDQDAAQIAGTPVAA